MVRRIENLLKERFRDQDAIVQAIKAAGIPERTVKRRFKAATGVPLIDYLQNVRIEHGKHLLETTGLPVEEISSEAGYSGYLFFSVTVQAPRGATPFAYRQMFGRSP